MDPRHISHPLYSAPGLIEQLQRFTHGSCNTDTSVRSHTAGGHRFCCGHSRSPVQGPPRADARGILDGYITGRDHPLRRSDQPRVTVWTMAGKVIEMLLVWRPMPAFFARTI